MRKSLATGLITTLLTVGLAASPAAAAPPLDVSITADEAIGAGGNFVASGPAVTAGLLCGTGVTTNVVGPAHGAATLIFKVDKTFVCDDATGTFTLRLNVRLDTTTSFTTANWRVVAGTGDYTDLRGNGSLIGTPIIAGTSITDDYTGRLR
ncbi:MAG: hypothetical protein OEU32_06270 [Acidimicrobiia bacterium]|nr:hypothetical protein [Acidimicrobiia bacterium]